MRHTEHCFGWPDSRITILVWLLVTTLSTYFLFWVGGDHWLVARWPIGFVAKFSKQSSVYVGDTFQYIHMMYVVFVLMMSILTSNNNMRTRHVQFLEFDSHTTFHPTWQWNLQWTKPLSDLLYLGLGTVCRVNQTQEHCECSPF